MAGFLLALCSACGARSSEPCRADCGVDPITPGSVCGNGVRENGESCDDGNTKSGDGCTSSCQVMRGWSCVKVTPDVCSPVCGDGITLSAACDDGNTFSNDGCSAACEVEDGWRCDASEPSLCQTICGDGQIRGSETCDDGNVSAGDGCTPNCVARDVWAPLGTSPSVQARINPAALWTGSEVFVWGGLASRILTQGFVYDPVLNRVRLIPVEGAPEAYGEFGLVSTGSMVLVLDLQGPSSSVSRYDLRAERWLPPGAACPLAPRSDHVIAWTGRELLVWGGRTHGNPTTAVFGDGARYDPELDRWTPMDMTSAPAARARPSVAWSGTELIVWSGENQAGGVFQDGARYDPELDLWTRMSSDESPWGSSGVSAVWTGAEMIVLSVPGGRYDPQSDTWATVSDASDVFEAKYAFSTGSEIFAWDGEHAGVYVPAIDDWRPLRREDTAFDCFGCALVFTGNEVIAWGGLPPMGARFSIEEGRWRPFSFSEGPPPETSQSAIWTGSEMIIWGSHESSPAGGRYNPTDNVWRPLSIAGDASIPTGGTAVWTGSEMIVIAADGSAMGGARYRPEEDEWRTMATADVLSPRAFFGTLWTGTEVIVFGGSNADTPLGDGARYDPALDAWRPLPREGAPSPRAGPILAWTGTEVLVYGGATSTILGLRKAQLSDGALYDPATDRWRAISPNPGIFHAHGFGVWTGQSLLVWDNGSDRNGVWQFDPRANDWARAETAPPPLMVYAGAGTVWTGREVLLWGGYTGRQFLAEGAMYDPATHLWRSFPNDGAPSARLKPVMLWTGDQLLLWGGGAEGARFLR